MNAQFYGGITVDLNDGPVRTAYFRDINGKPCAQLIIGEANQSVAISVGLSGPDVVAELQEKVAELAAWTQRMEQLRGLPEVA